MRISDWSSDVCSSDLEEDDERSGSTRGPGEEPDAIRRQAPGLRRLRARGRTGGLPQPGQVARNIGDQRSTSRYTRTYSTFIEKGKTSTKTPSFPPPYTRNAWMSTKVQKTSQ